MKQIVAIILIPIYLLLTTGIQVDRHFCGGELASVSYFFGKTSCACGDEVLEMDCCEDVSETIALEDDQQTSFYAFYFDGSGAAFALPARISPLFAFTAEMKLRHAAAFKLLHPRPALEEPPSAFPIYLKNRNLRI